MVNNAAGHDRGPVVGQIHEILSDISEHRSMILGPGSRPARVHPVAILAVWERWRGRTIPLKAYLLLFLGVGFAAASFQTWRHEYATRVLAELMSFKGRNPETVRRLQNYYADAATFYIQATEPKSDAEFKKTEKSVDEWMTGLADWFKKNMGSGATVRLIESSNPSPTLKNVKPERVELIVALGTIRDNLAKFVESPAWDKP